MDKKTLQEMQGILLKEKARAEKELSRFKSRPVKEDSSLEDTLKKLLRDIHKALKRVEEGTYGTCKYCSREIHEARLRARPASSSCIACKKTLTRDM